MPHSVVFAGLDVHAAQTQAARLDAATGEVATTRLAGGSAPALAWLRSQGPAVVGVYEAGPSGFALARTARHEGIDLRVVTPGLIPKRPTDRVKTDRRARSAWRGCWRPANCPSPGSPPWPRSSSAIWSAPASRAHRPARPRPASAPAPAGPTSPALA